MDHVYLTEIQIESSNSNGRYYLLCLYKQSQEQTLAVLLLIALKKSHATLLYMHDFDIRLYPTLEGYLQMPPLL